MHGFSGKTKYAARRFVSSGFRCGEPRGRWGWHDGFRVCGLFLSHQSNSGGNISGGGSAMSFLLKTLGCLDSTSALGRWRRIVWEFFSVSAYFDVKLKFSSQRAQLRKFNTFWSCAARAPPLLLICWCPVTIGSRSSYLSILFLIIVIFHFLLVYIGSVFPVTVTQQLHTSSCSPTPLPLVILLTLRLGDMCWEWFSATTMANFSSVSVKMAKLKTSSC